MTDMTKDKGHLNGLARSLGIKPPCREEATGLEMQFAAMWMRLRGMAYREEVAARRVSRGSDSQ